MRKPLLKFFYAAYCSCVARFCFLLIVIVLALQAFVFCTSLLFLRCKLLFFAHDYEKLIVINEISVFAKMSDFAKSTETLRNFVNYRKPYGYLMTTFKLQISTSFRSLLYNKLFI